MTGRSHLAVHDSPDFLGQVLGELTGVSDDDNTTLEGLEGLGKGTKRVTVEVVGGFVKNDHVRALPRAGGKHDLDTLTTGETSHTGVGDQLSLDTELGAVGFDLLADQGTELTAGEGLLLVNLGNHFGVRLDDFVPRNPGVVVGHHGNPALLLEANVLTKSERTFVLVGVLELSAGVDTNDTTLSAFDVVDLVHSLLIVVGDDLVGTVHGLTVLTGLETPLDVFGGGLFEVVINVSESVLLDVGDTDVLVLVDLTTGGNQFTGQDVDQSRFTGTVGTNDGNTRAQGHLETNVRNLGTRSTRVLEGHVGDTDDGLGLGLDTLEVTGLGELELHVRSTKLVVRAGSRDLLDELAQTTTVALELEALVVDDVLDNVVQKAAVVRDHDGCARRVDEVVLQPFDVLDVQVVGGFVEQENVWVFEHSTGQSELHLPTTRKGGDGAFELLTEETEFLKLGFDLILLGVQTNITELLHSPENDGLLSIGSVEIVLNVDSLDLVLLRETIKLLIVDGTHEGCLTGTVGTEQTVTLTTLETKVSLVKEDLGTVGQREGAIAQVLTLLFVGGDVVDLSGFRRGLLAKALGNPLGISLTNNGGDVGLSVLSPADNLGILLVDKLTRDSTDIVDDSLGLLGMGLVLVGKDLLEDTSDSGGITSGGDLGDLAVLDITNTDKSLKGLIGLLTSFGVGQSLVVLLEAGHQLGQEGSDDLRVVHKLTHIIDDDGRLTLDGSVTFNETTVQKRNHNSQGGASDIRNESGRTQKMDSLGNVLGLGDTLDELGDEALNILVDDQTADLLHGGVGGLLDLSLGVPHGLGDNGDQVGNLEGELSGGAANKNVDTLEGGHLLSPLGGVGDRLEDRRKDGLDSVGVDGLDDGEGGSLSGVLDGNHLVTDGGQDGAEESDEVRLNTGGNGRLGSDGPDGLEGPLTGVGVLLVGKLLLEALDSPKRRKIVVSHCPIFSWQFFAGATYLRGRTCSGMGPLNREAMLPEAAFTSSGLLETLRVFIRPSRTSTDSAASLLEVAGTEVAAGILNNFWDSTQRRERKDQKQERAKAFYQGISRRGGGPKKKKKSLRLRNDAAAGKEIYAFGGSFCLYRRQKRKIKRGPDLFLKRRKKEKGDEEERW